MRISDIFLYAFSAIRLRKLRAGLTTLGVVIGIAAIVALLSLGQGFQDAITAQFEAGFATNTLIVSAQGFGAGQSSFRLLVDDTKTIDNIGNVSRSIAIIQKPCIINASGRSFALTASGVNFSQYADIFGTTFVAEDGIIPLNPSDEVVVIGNRIRNPWENDTVLGDVNGKIEISWSVRINNTYPPQFEKRNYTATIATVLKKIGGFSIGGPSDVGIYIPISQAQRFFETNECETIIAQLTRDDESTISATSESIRRAFDKQVSVTSPTAVLSIISSVFSVVELFLAGIAGISLLVAGIGIMNIMIVSLMERTREIGILKALGMRNHTTLLIFLSEAIIIGLMGAAIGVASGWGLANIVGRFGFAGFGGGMQQGNRNGFAGGAGMNGGMHIVPVLTPTVLAGSLAFGLIVSVVFGLYPAWRASKLKPVEALRHE